MDDSNDLLKELELVEHSHRVPDCGCNDGDVDASPASELDDLPSLLAELDALESGSLEDFGELEQAAGHLDLDDELEFAAAAADDGCAGDVTLEDLLALAKRFPGVRISFGY